MWQVHGFEGRVLAGWERGKTEKGVPYYIHHESQQTQWDHPLLVATMEEILDSNDIKYAAYRTASKIRILQKFTKMHLVTLPTIISLFDQHGFRIDQNDNYMYPDELESLLTDIFHVTKRDQASHAETKVLAEIALNLLMNFYDRPRSGLLKVVHCKVALTLFSSARLQEKYKYLFRQFADHNNCISRKKLADLLDSLAQIPEYLSEKPSFGVPLVAAAADSCFRAESSHLGVAEEAFLEWLLREPQTLVWISTMYRVASAEAVSHDAKCSVCKMCPIAGLRYQCLRCFHYDLCQNCFFMGRINKRHKLYHPLQEYCYQSTSKEGTKAWMQTIRNKFSRKTSAKSKQRYLPITVGPPPNDLNELPSNAGAAENQENVYPGQIPKMPENETPREEEEDATLHSRTIHQQSLPQNGVENDRNHQKELESIIVHLEEEKRHLLLEIDKLRGGKSSIPSSSEQQQLAVQMARQETLENHNHQLEIQLKRLKSLLQYLQKTPVRNIPGGMRLQTPPHLESTPLDRFALLSPINPAYPVAANHSEFQFSPRDRWDRPFGSQSGFARRSLPSDNFRRAYPNEPPSASFQRASARAVLQNRDFANNVPHSARFLGQETYVPMLANPFLTPNATQYTLNDIPGDLLGHTFPITADTAGYRADSSDGMSKIQLELDAIIHQLETVYPGCSAQQKSQTEMSEKAKIIHAAGEIESMLKELVTNLFIASSAGNPPEQRSIVTFPDQSMV